MNEDRIVQQLDKMVRLGRVTEEEAKACEQRKDHQSSRWWWRRHELGTLRSDLMLRSLRTRWVGRRLTTIWRVSEAEPTRGASGRAWRCTGNPRLRDITATSGTFRGHWLAPPIRLMR